MGFVKDCLEFPFILTSTHFVEKYSSSRFGFGASGKGSHSSTRRLIHNPCSHSDHPTRGLH